MILLLRERERGRRAAAFRQVRALQRGFAKAILPALLRQTLYDHASARVLDDLADRIEGLKWRRAGEQERHQVQLILIAAEEEALRLLPVLKLSHL